MVSIAFPSFLTFFKVCWIPILKGKKLILAGDPLQLPPTIMSTDGHAISKSNGSGSRSNKKDSVKSSSKVTTSSSTTKQGGDQPTARSSEDGAVSKSRSQGGATGSSSRLMPSRSLEVTLFDRLEKMYGGNRIKRMLTLQYR